MIPTSCPFCKYYSPDLKSGTGNGVCHKRPPAAVLISQGVISIWPPVAPANWCAEGEQGISAESVKAGEDLIKKGDKGNGHRH